MRHLRLLADGSLGLLLTSLAAAQDLIGESDIVLSR